MHLIPLATVNICERERDEDPYLFVLQGSGPISNQYKRLGEEFSQGHLVISPGLIDFISPKTH